MFFPDKVIIMHKDHSKQFWLFNAKLKTLQHALDYLQLLNAKFYYLQFWNTTV